LPFIRKARLEDAGALARLAEATFRSTFGAANAHEDMDLHCRSRYSEAIQSGEIADPDMLTLLSVAAEGLVGFAQLHWDGAPACVSARSPGEIQRLYVADEWHGKGIAQDLMNACIEALRARGSDVVWLGVWEHNPRAIAFYRKSGFVEVGDHVFSVGNDPQRDIVMARPVAGHHPAVAPMP
jgi:diamine N-acetyltransferase